VTTDASGQWSDTFSVSIDNDPNGGSDGGFWTMTAHYAGDVSHDASNTPSCSFLEAPD
jgi:hypothetical protein